MITVIFRNYQTDRIQEMEFKTRAELFNYQEERADVLTIEDYEYSDNHMGFVNVYEVTREYGGSEEGGWYYNSLRCIESIPVRKSHSEAMIKWAEEEYNHVAHGNIYSVLGGSQLDIIWEDEPCGSETKERPYYE